MKITKYQHSCLLVEMPSPMNRTVLFDPGIMSEAVLKVDELVFLDDIVITHVHADHYSQTLVGELVAKFPQAHITTTPEVIAKLESAGITGAKSVETESISFFNSQHADVEPLFPRPENIGVHYEGTLTHPGDSHEFTETKSVLALPIAGPWASMITAVNLAISLQPRYVVPIHDWHLSDIARTQMYELLEQALSPHDITFVPLSTGQPVTIDG